MKKLVLTFAVLLAGSSFVLAAREGQSAGGEIKQKNCPMSGKAINEEKFAEYEGQKVYFCCAGCKEKFEKEPAKYAPAAYKAMYPQSVQVKCPLSGKPVNPDVKAEGKGQEVAFCCGGCKEKYTEDPAKYAEKLNAASTTQVHCPLSGKAINPAISAEVDGRTVYFCCEGCQKKVKADPARFKEAGLPEAGVVARGATAKDDLVKCPTCAAHGEGHHKRGEMKTAAVDGKLYFLCSDHCVAEFKKDPAKYRKSLEEKPEKAESKG